MNDPRDDDRAPIGAEGLLVYDGECGFCRRWVRHMETWFDVHPVAVAWQKTDLDALGLTPKQCAEAVQFVAVDGRVSSGSDAAAHVLMVAGFPYNMVGRLMCAPIVRSIAAATYRWIAANRHRFRGDPVRP